MKAKLEKPARLYTTQQLGDACEMLVAANLTLAGVPAMLAPKNWPGYDIIAQPAKGKPLRISVKACNLKRISSAYVAYDYTYDFEWLAVVLILPEGGRRFFLVPRDAADNSASTDGQNAKTSEKYWLMSKIEDALERWENNFRLDEMFAARQLLKSITWFDATRIKDEELEKWHGEWRAEGTTRPFDDWLWKWRLSPPPGTNPITGESPNVGYFVNGEFVEGEPPPDWVWDGVPPKPNSIKNHLMNKSRE